MMHTNFQGHGPFGSRKEDFFNFFTIYEAKKDTPHVNLKL